MHDRLQGVKSEYNIGKIIESTSKHDKHKRRLNKYDEEGRPKKDPLGERLDL